MPNCPFRTEDERTHFTFWANELSRQTQIPGHASLKLKTRVSSTFSTALFWRLWYVSRNF